MKPSPITDRPILYFCPICDYWVGEKIWEKIEEDINCYGCGEIKIRHFEPKFWEKNMR
jgi:hypothetical protein